MAESETSAGAPPRSTVPSLTVTQVPIDAIMVGDRARADVGRLDNLIASIREEGLLHPLLITPGMQLLSGERRLYACREIGMIEVPTVMVTYITDAADWMGKENKVDLCRKEMMPSEMVYVGRAFNTLKRPCPWPAHMTGQNRKTDELVGRCLGVCSTNYYRMRYLVQANEKGEPGAAEAVAEMSRTRNFSGVYNAFRGLDRSHGNSGKKRRASPPTPAQPYVPPRQGPPRTQHKTLSEVMSALSGLCHALNNVDVRDLDSTITPQQAADWNRQVNKALTLLRPLNTTLKEHSRGNA